MICAPYGCFFRLAFYKQKLCQLDPTEIFACDIAFYAQTDNTIGNAYRQAHCQKQALLVNIAEIRYAQAG
jgi:hypothetical protein